METMMGILVFHMSFGEEYLCLLGCFDMFKIIWL
jgi:hypothetical protein